jgi:hypothetical protein
MFARRVLPGAALVRASFRRTSAFSSVDLPTLDRPAIAICARPSAGIPSALTALVTKSALRIFNIGTRFAIRCSRFEARTATREPRRDQ